MNIKNKQGFSLMEILIVMGLIGILSAIAVPAYDSYRDNANTTVLKTDAGTAYKAMHTYNVVNNTFCAGLDVLGLKGLKKSETYVGSQKKGFVGFASATNGCSEIDLSAGTGMTLDNSKCTLQGDEFHFAVANTFNKVQKGFHVTNDNSSPSIAGNYCKKADNTVSTCNDEDDCKAANTACGDKGNTEAAGTWVTGGKLCQ